MSLFRSQMEVDQERKTWERAEAEKVKAAQLTESERFKFAARGLARVTLAAEEAARASGDEAAEVKAAALRRRMEKAERLHGEYVRVVDAVADHTNLDAAQKAYDAAVSKVAAKVAALLPTIPTDEAERLVKLYANPRTEYRAMMAEQAVAGALTATRMRLAREMWALLESSGGLAIGADSGARGLVEKGRGQ